MKLRLATLVGACALTVLSAAAVFAAAGERPGTRVPDRVVITLRPGMQPTVAKAAGGITVDRPALQALADRFGARDMSQLYAGVRPLAKAGLTDLSLVWAVDFATAVDLDAVLKAYAALPEVAKAEAVDICAQTALPNDSFLGSQWYLRNLTLGAKDVRAVGGWAEAHGDTNVIIAIVDSGVDWHHPDLGGSGPNYRRGAIWTNWAEVNGLPGVDDDGNGKIDDFRGWDFVTGVTGVPGEDVSVPDNDPSDWESHGTACSGVAAAITNNGTGIAGTSWGCKIMPVRVGWLPDGATGGVVRMDFASQGMIYAAANGAKIINCSWGSTSYLQSAVDYCLAAGVLVVTAAGNDNNEVASFLASYDGVLAVAATDANDLKTSFSSYGTWVELSAPGTGIFTTWFINADGSHTYNTVDGTSFSSPLTCGAAALVWSALPTLTNMQVGNRLMTSADNIDALNPGLAGKLGAGRVNLLRALGDRLLTYPDEFSSLLDAQNEAAPGDTVALSAAVPLNGPITVANKAFYLFGGYNAGFTTRDPLGTPTLLNATAGATGLLFQPGTGLGTVVDGLRISGGGGQVFSSPQAGRYGGGIICNGSSPTLRNLEVTGCSVGTSVEFGGGGGVVLVNSTALLDNVTVHGNQAVQGGGVYVYQGAPTLRNCRIYDNVLVQDNGAYPPRGGGVYATDTALQLNGCEISGHVDADAGGGVYAANTAGTTSLALVGNRIHHNTARAKGAGLFMSGSALTMLRDELHDNGKAAGATFMTGGAFAVETATVTIDSVRASTCTAQVGAGGAITGSPQANVRHSVFSGNTCDYFGGGLSYQTVAAGEIRGNTFAANLSTLGAAGVYLNTASPAIANNIFALNGGGTTFGNAVHAQSSVPTFTCNDAWSNTGTNYTGVTDPTGTAGNIALDPQFCDAATGNYGIKALSPCDPAVSGGCGLIGALGLTCSPTPVFDDPQLPALVFRVEPATPNPFNPLTRIRFTLPAAGRVGVRVYDVAGRLVRVLVDGVLPAATHVALWNGRDDAGRAVASGVYFYRVTAGADTYTGRMALVK
ncbi:MAG: S8 family serine peptidase [Candidatus Krumholzibacteriia bacterium]